jgi:putative acetyltransferase
MSMSIEVQLERSGDLVLGHAEYYPRFGFVKASTYGIRSEYAVPDEVFMALELKPGVLGGRGGGVVRYRPEFAAPQG